MKKPSGYWKIKENRNIAASTCTSKWNYGKQYSRAYIISKELNELEEFSLKFNWKIKKEDNYWLIKENREKEAIKYKTRSDYCKYSGSSYSISCKLKELDEFALKYNWLTIGNFKKRLIYVFIFDELKTVYVGLTCNETRRKKEHLTKNSIVYNFITDNNITYEYKLLSDYILDTDAIKLESYYMDYYLDLGYELLCNRNRSGQLGGNIQKWTKNKRELEASKCKSRTEYSKISNGSPYNVSCKINGELNEFALKFKWINFSLPYGYWTKEKREEKAKICKSRSEFKLKYGSAYQITLVNSELDEFALKFNWISKQKPSGYWKIKENRNIAASNCNTVSEYLKNYPTSYRNSNKNEILEFTLKYNW